LTDEEAVMNMMKRVEANDPVSLRQMGRNRYEEGDYNGAFQYWTKAAELGDVGAHYELSCSYAEGEGVEIDEEKRVYHLEHAAIGGNPRARYNLGCKRLKIVGWIEQLSISLSPPTTVITNHWWY
jgi:TPR repeat protein